MRGIFGLISGALVVYSFRTHSLSEIYPILFSAPLFLIIISHFFLNEKVGIRRWTTVIIGFIGVLIVSRPGTIHFSISYLDLFISALLMAVNIALVRKFSNNQSSIAFTFYAFLSATFNKYSSSFASSNSSGNLSSSRPTNLYSVTLLDSLWEKS